MKKEKNRTMNELRQTKDSVYEVPTTEDQVTGTNNPWDVYSDIKYITQSYKEDVLYKLKSLRKKYPNNQEFGAQVAKYFML